MSETMLLTVREVAEEMRCCEASVYALIRRGELASIKAGRMRRVTRDELRRFIERHTLPA